MELCKLGAPFDFEENFLASGTHDLDKKPRQKGEFKKCIEQTTKRKVIQTNLDVDRRVGIIWLCLKILILSSLVAVVRHYWFPGDVCVEKCKTEMCMGDVVNSKKRRGNNEVQEQKQIVQAL